MNQNVGRSEDEGVMRKEKGALLILEITSRKEEGATRRMERPGGKSAEEEGAT